MQGLAFIVFNCSMLRFGVVIAMMEAVRAWGKSYRQLGVLQHSRDILLSCLVRSFVDRGHRHSVRTVPVLCMPMPNGRNLGTGSTSSLSLGRVEGYHAANMGASDQQAMLY